MNTDKVESLTRVVTKLTDNRWMNLFSVVDPTMHCKGFQFAQRRGKDSIAFICLDLSIGTRLDDKCYLLNNEFLPPTGEFLTRAFGGSLDKDGYALEDIVKEELKEEVGFDEGRIIPAGKCFVSSMMDQYCHLFLVLVDKAKCGVRDPQNGIEALATPVWVSAREILAGNDWKAITIISKINAMNVQI